MGRLSRLAPPISSQPGCHSGGGENMPPKEEGFEQRLAAAASMPSSAQKFLYLYWLLANELLKKLAEESAQIRPVDRSAEDVREWMRNAQEHIDKSENLQVSLRRVESYLGHKPRGIDHEFWKMRRRSQQRDGFAHRFRTVTPMKT
jgi:hypothetical protein